MSMKKFGKGWHQFPKYLSGYSRAIPVLEKLYLESVGKGFLKTIKDRILSQPSDVPALSPYWVAEKARQGLDERMWIATGFFLDNLNITQVKKGVIFVGASRRKIHRPSGKTMAELMEMFEYGDPSKRIPPRPILRGAVKTFAKRHRAIVAMVSGMFFASAAGRK